MRRRLTAISRWLPAAALALAAAALSAYPGNTALLLLDASRAVLPAGFLQ